MIWLDPHIHSSQIPIRLGWPSKAHHFWFTSTQQTVHEKHRQQMVFIFSLSTCSLKLCSSLFNCRSKPLLFFRGFKHQLYYQLLSYPTGPTARLFTPTWRVPIWSLNPNTFCFIMTITVFQWPVEVLVTASRVPHWLGLMDLFRAQSQPAISVAQLGFFKYASLDASTSNMFKSYQNVSIPQPFTSPVCYVC
jgi:hypothetical protein